jgi:glycosyltransferase involved in cell wall biosynthesis
MNKTSFWIIPFMYVYNIDTPLFISVNTNPNFHYRKRIYGKYLIRFLYPLKKVTAIVPVSKELKEILINKYKLDGMKIKPIYNGFDIERIQNLAKENVSDYNMILNDKSIIKFITIGRLSKEKGHKYLIDAFSKVIREIPNSRLFIIGEGPLRAKLIKSIKDNMLENKVILLGIKKNPYKYISKANVFVLSSLHEGLPTVLIEALVCNMPVISTNCETGPTEILDDGKYGFLTNVADSDDLAEKMILLAKSVETRETFSKKSIDRISIFEKEKFIEKWTILIEDYSKMI